MIDRGKPTVNALWRLPEFGQSLLDSIATHALSRAVQNRFVREPNLLEIGGLSRIIRQSVLPVALPRQNRSLFGLPVTHVSFNLHDNDRKLIKATKEKTMEVMRAAGATEVVQEARYSHLVGAARMGSTHAPPSLRSSAAPTTSQPLRL